MIKDQVSTYSKYFASISVFICRFYYGFFRLLSHSLWARFRLHIISMWIEANSIAAEPCERPIVSLLWLARFGVVEQFSHFIYRLHNRTIAKKTYSKTLIARWERERKSERARAKQTDIERKRERQKERKRERERRRAQMYENARRSIDTKSHIASCLATLSLSPGTICPSTNSQHAIINVAIGTGIRDSNVKQCIRIVRCRAVQCSPP